MTEAEIQARIMREVGGRRDVRLFRNNVGTAWQGEVVERTGGVVILKHPRPITFGLCEGSSDLIGWRSVEITPAMVGRRVAVFVPIEVKTPTGRPSEGQIRFLAKAAADGAWGGVARSPAEAIKLVTPDVFG